MKEINSEYGSRRDAIQNLFKMGIDYGIIRPPYAVSTDEDENENANRLPSFSLDSEETNTSIVELKPVDRDIKMTFKVLWDTEDMNYREFFLRIHQMKTDPDLTKAEFKESFKVLNILNLILILTAHRNIWPFDYNDSLLAKILFSYSTQFTTVNSSDVQSTIRMPCGLCSTTISPCVTNILKIVTEEGAKEQSVGCCSKCLPNLTGWYALSRLVPICHLDMELGFYKPYLELEGVSKMLAAREDQEPIKKWSWGFWKNEIVTKRFDREAWMIADIAKIKNMQKVKQILTEPMAIKSSGKKKNVRIREENDTDLEDREEEERPKKKRKLENGKKKSGVIQVKSEVMEEDDDLPPPPPPPPLFDMDDFLPQVKEERKKKKKKVKRQLIHEMEEDIPPAPPSPPALPF